jgi:hypothetical protein
MQWIKAARISIHCQDSVPSSLSYSKCNQSVYIHVCFILQLNLLEKGKAASPYCIHFHILHIFLSPE